MAVSADDILLDRMVSALELVRERLLRSTRALTTAGVPYAVAGGNAVAAWVSTIDREAVRDTADVNILIRRPDLTAARVALEAAGFVYRHVGDIDVFLDGPDGRARSGVPVIFAGEKVREHEPVANPDVSESKESPDFRVLSLEALVRIKLTAFRDKDRTHLRDMLGVGLIDAGWVARFPPELGQWLQQLIDTPEG